MFCLECGRKLTASEEWWASKGEVHQVCTPCLRKDWTGDMLRMHDQESNWPAAVSRDDETIGKAERNMQYWMRNQ